MGYYIPGDSWVPDAALLPGEWILHGDAVAQQRSKRALAAPGKAAAVADRGFTAFSVDILFSRNDGIHDWW